MQSFATFEEEKHMIRAYADWGWIAPTGKVYSGVPLKRVSDHLGLMSVANKGKAGDLMNWTIAYSRGWIRWFENTKTKTLTFEGEPTHTTYLNMSKFFKTYMNLWDTYEMHFHAGHFKNGVVINADNPSLFLTKIHAAAQ